MPSSPKRHDHTDWLTHFVRDRNPSQDFPGETEDERSIYAGGEISRDAKAFEVLKAIIRLGGIRPGRSFRGGRTTIYGGKPAVCATEMPLYAFATYARQRAQVGNVSAYGIAFLKSEFYAAGGRPAIYGLSTDHLSYVQDSSIFRILNDQILPIREQYRYVAYNPNRAPHRLDWSHEREWRWIVQDRDQDQIWMKDYDDTIGPKTALPIFKGRLDGRPFTRTCIIVWSQDEANQIRNLMTALYLSGSNNYDTPFDRSLIRRSRLIVLEDVVKLVEQGNDIDAQTIEGLDDANLLQSIGITEPPANAEELVAEAFDEARATAANALKAYDARHSGRSSGFGAAHVATKDITSPIVQHMLATGDASGPFDDVVWINCTSGSVTPNVERAVVACQAAATSLAERLQISTYVITHDD